MSYRIIRSLFRVVELLTSLRAAPPERGDRSLRRILAGISETFRESFPPSLRVVSDISELRCAYYVVYYLDSILHMYQIHALIRIQASYLHLRRRLDSPPD